MHKEEEFNTDQENRRMGKESNQYNENKNSFSVSNGSCNDSIEDDVVNGNYSDDSSFVEKENSSSDRQHIQQRTTNTTSKLLNQKESNQFREKGNLQQIDGPQCEPNKDEKNHTLNLNQDRKQHKKQKYSLKKKDSQDNFSFSDATSQGSPDKQQTSPVKQSSFSEYSSQKSTPFSKNQMNSSPLIISNSNSIGENSSEIKQSCFSNSYDDFVKSGCISRQVSSQQTTKQPLELDDEKRQNEFPKKKLSPFVIFEEENGKEYAHNQKDQDFQGQSNPELRSFQEKIESNQLLEKMRLFNSELKQEWTQARNELDTLKTQGFGSFSSDIIKKDHNIDEAKIRKLKPSFDNVQDNIISKNQKNVDILNPVENQLSSSDTKEEITDNMKQLEQLEFEKQQLKQQLLLKENFLRNIQSNNSKLRSTDVERINEVVVNLDKQDNQQQTFQKKIKPQNGLRKSDKHNKETKQLFSLEQTLIPLKNGNKNISKSANKNASKVKEQVKKFSNVDYELYVKDNSENIDNTSNKLDKDIALIKKDLDEKYQMRLEDIHYSYHLKILKLSDRLAKTEAENVSIKQQLNDLKTLNMQMASKTNITEQDLRYGVLIAEEIGVNSLEEVFQKLKILLDNRSQEKKFISCITDLVSRCTSNISNQDKSSEVWDSRASERQMNQKQVQEGDNKKNGIRYVNDFFSENGQNIKTNGVSLKQAWKWIKFIMEDYALLKSYNQTNNSSQYMNPNIPKMNTLFQSGHSMKSAPNQSQFMYQNQQQNNEDSKLLSLVKKMMKIDQSSEVISALQVLLQEKQKISNTLNNPNQHVNQIIQQQIQQGVVSRYSRMNSLTREISPQDKGFNNQQQQFMAPLQPSVGQQHQPKKQKPKTQTEIFYSSNSKMFLTNTNSKQNSSKNNKNQKQSVEISKNQQIPQSSLLISQDHFNNYSNNFNNNITDDNQNIHNYNNINQIRNSNSTLKNISSNTRKQYISPSKISQSQQALPRSDIVQDGIKRNSKEQLINQQFQNSNPNTKSQILLSNPYLQFGQI